MSVSAAEQQRADTASSSIASPPGSSPGPGIPGPSPSSPDSRSGGKRADPGIRWIRTYTRSLEYTVTCGRSVVIDPQHCEPFYLDSYNYWPLLERLDCGTVIIEWDIALSLEDRQRFAAHVSDAPGRVQVAPYRQYTGWCAGAQRGRIARGEHAYVHRTPGDDLTDLSQATGAATGHFLLEGEPECVLFGFGLVYVPGWVCAALRGDLERGEGHLRASYGDVLGGWLARREITDVTFSYWHWAALGHAVPVHWDVRPVHLHYEV